MRVTIGPAHAAASPTRGEMCPLHMPEVLIIKVFRQRLVQVLKAVNGAMLTVKKWSLITYLRQRLAHQPTRDNGCIHCIVWFVDGRMFIKMGASKIKHWVTKGTLDNAS